MPLPSNLLADWFEHKIRGEPDAVNLIRTSQNRIEKAYQEILSGYDIDPASILKIVETLPDDDPYRGIVWQRDIPFTSMCGHHFLPFFGTIDIAYQPNKKIVGLGKLPRLAHAISARLQLQEFIVRDIVRSLDQTLAPQGAFAIAWATHMCIHGRGPQAIKSQTICSYGIGSLEHYTDSGCN